MAQADTKAAWGSDRPCAAFLFWSDHETGQGMDTHADVALRCAA